MPDAPSLRSRLFARLMIPLVALVIVSAALAYYAAFRFANQVYDSWISDTTIALSQLTRNGPAGFSLDLPAAAQHMLASNQRDNTYYRIADLSGGFIAGHRMLPAPETMPETGRTPICYDAVFDGEPVRVAIYRPSDVAIVVQVAETVTKRDVLAFEIIAGMLLPLLLLVALGAASVWIGVDVGLRPLTRLAEQLRDRSPQDLGPLDESVTPREVRPLVHALNGLLGRVDEMLSAQRRFVGDAAHQLRTPIAGLKTQAEMALRAGDADTLKTMLGNIVGGTTRLAALVAQLLSLARAEPKQSDTANHRALDLDLLARSVTADWISRALEAGIDLGFAGSDQPAWVTGDAVLLREMLGNLIDNAIKYCPHGSEATVSVQAAAGRVRLGVTDNGPGIPAEERERVFERFYRASDSTIPGTGLGLSIVRELAAEHGATARLDAGDHGQGIRVTVEFPAGPPDTSSVHHPPGLQARGTDS